MVGIGIFEILCILVFGLMFLAVAAAVTIVIVNRATAGKPAVATPASSPAAAVAPPPAQASHLDPAVQASLVARLTQRFCPQCRSPLAADSPEGLCPACLMAGAIGGFSHPRPGSLPEGEGVINGLAATTPPSGSKPPLDSAALAEIGELQQHFPQLEIVELLGRGGMGAVYKARQKNLDRMIALKVIPPDAAKDPAFAERFSREARAMARLNHPNIVTVYDFGQIGELYYLLMEYVDGVNLRHTLRTGKLAPQEALAIVPAVCDALQYAHDQGVVHRDIKPENVLLDRLGRVKIADFGLAKLLGKGPDDFTLTRTQQVMGTPRYMAPEQIERPSAVDHRADIYSLGVVLYEMLTGELPLGRFEPPSHKVQVDVRIDQVVLRSLEKDPQRRYQRASEVKTELASAVSWPTLAASAANLPSPLVGEGPGVR
ncbi:MAG TPA: serine/threonine-protein kinase, partial [Pirellulaceae bacterium]|nr:serine/threonine-protein kinase [Pirellulaceae bacterium]